MGRRGRGGRNRNHQQRGPQHHNGDQQGQHSGQNHGQRQNQSQRSDRVLESRQQGGSNGSGKASFPSIVQPRKAIQRPPQAMAVAPHNDSKSYRVIFYDTLNQAKADLEQLKRLAASCDQLNIVVRAEASMDDADLNQVGKLFCGAAWALVHERRKADGWYQDATA